MTENVDVTHIPEQPGGSVTAGAVLALMHVATAVIVAWLLVGTGGTDEPDQSTSE